MIPKCLTNLHVNRARVAALDAEIKRLQALAKQLEGDVSVRAVVRYGEESRHPEGWHSDPTGRAAVCDLPEDMRQLYEDIRGLIIERGRTASSVSLAEQALAFLPERLRIVVEFRVIEGMSWADVGDEVYERTGHDYSERALRNQLNSALKKIEPFFT